MYTFLYTSPINELLLIHLSQPAESSTYPSTADQLAAWHKISAEYNYHES